MDLLNKIDFLVNVKLRQASLFYRIYKKKNIPPSEIKIVGMIRERNESLLLKDTLDHLAQHVDAIVVFDDASTDDSVEIANSHPAVVEVIQNKKWRKHNRAWEETANRRKLHNVAKKYKPEWLFYCDADERFEGNIKKFLLEDCPKDVNAIRISLFDAYITKEDKDPYNSTVKLYGFRKFFGPERRDIIMIWRNISTFEYNRQDAREPQNVSGKQITKFFCQHYGKSLSINQWEDTCDYYINFFPKYSAKWRARKGKAVHETSDFDRELYTWDKVKDKAVKIG